MKKAVTAWQTAGFVFTGICGVILHFLFDWTGQNPLVAPFAAVNESIWEHMKLLFVPMFVFALAESRCIGKAYKGFWQIKLVGILLGIVLIPTLYYTLRGIFGVMPDFVNIAIFFVVAATSYWVETSLFGEDSTNSQSPSAALATLWLLAAVFVLLTFLPPHIPLFMDPVTGTYGF